ncbi:substrate-binding periplasmic protein [Roseateles sp. BYS87W]|uniref:Substrate-binding periplasmic protein n=1 Tax=Pelomonas baiyunensis TaxID=3299026 RepID=A0ABW7H0U3_9BURK
MKRRPLLLAVACGVAGVSTGQAGAAGARERVVYPLHDPARIPSWRYLEDVLKLAIQRSGANYELVESRQAMVQGRAMRELAEGRGDPDLAWTMTSPEREAELLPVRVPVDRGLIGCRVAFVRPGDLDRWTQVRTLADLAPLAAGQGHDWPDTEILRANGLKVQTSSRYETLFEMLRLGRIDYFPRSVIEVDDEAATSMARGLVIEPQVLLRYPAAAYLFVRPNRPQLAQDLERGLEAALADGSFQRLFQRHYGDLIARHRLNQRRVLTLRNPLLPPATPLNRPALWLVLGG